MAVKTSSRSLLTGALAVTLWALAQTSLCSAGLSSHAEFEFSFTPPTFPTFPLPTLPHFALPPLPQFSLPQLPHFSLPSLPSQLTLPGLNVPQFSLPPLQPLDIPALNLPPLPQPTFSLPQQPGFELPPTTVLPPSPSFRIPGISIPPQAARTMTIPQVNLADITVPGLAIPQFSLPPTTLTLPQPGVVPRLPGFPGRPFLRGSEQTKI